MKKLLLAWVLLGVAVSVFAQTTDAAARQIDFEGELSRIQVARARQETQYQKEEAICYGKFAVTDCLHAVRARRRESFELLRKQEVALRQAERQFKAAQQLERLKEKTFEERSAQGAANRLEAMQAQKAREERANQKAQSQAKPTLNVSQDRKKTSYQGRSEADRAQEKKQYQDKQDQAREQRALREKTRLEKSGTKAKPLPPAP